MQKREDLGKESGTNCSSSSSQLACLDKANKFSSCEPKLKENQEGASKDSRSSSRQFNWKMRLLKEHVRPTVMQCIAWGCAVQWCKWKPCFTLSWVSLCFAVCHIYRHNVISYDILKKSVGIESCRLYRMYVCRIFGGNIIFKISLNFVGVLTCFNCRFLFFSYVMPTFLAETTGRTWGPKPNDTKFIRNWKENEWQPILSDSFVWNSIAVE